MISDVFQVLRDSLLDHLRRSSGWNPAEASQEHVVFAPSEKLDTIEFKLGAVTMMLVNIEEDRSARPADPYRRTLPDGTALLVQAPVPLNLYILFVARFTDYLDSLRNLALIVRFFQKNRVIDQESTPALSSQIERLSCELLTIPITESNHVWSALNTAYQPSLLYKIRMVVFHDEEGVPAAAPGAPSMRINQ